MRTDGYRSRWFLGLVLFPCWIVLAAAESPPVPLISGSLPAHPVPFKSGEKVRYEIHWQPLGFGPAVLAAEVELEIQRIQHAEIPAYRITARASTAGVLVSMGIQLDDRLESIVEAAHFGALRFRHQKRQNKRSRDLAVDFDYNRNRGSVRELDVAVEPNRTLREETFSKLPGLISDALSVFYAGRIRDLRPGQSYLVHFNDNGRLKELGVMVEKRERIRAALGPYDTTRVATRKGLFKGEGSLRMWYSRDQFKVPVRFDASAKLGRVYGELISLESPTVTKTRIRVP